MATTVTLARNLNLAVGDNTFPDPARTPNGAPMNQAPYSLSADTGNVPASVTVRVSIQSNRTGQWEEEGFFAFPGGPWTTRQGAQSTVRTMDGDWPGGNGRVVVNVTAACVVSNVTLTN